MQDKQSGTFNGLLKMSANENWQNSWFIYICQIEYDNCTVQLNCKLAPNGKV